MALKIDLLPFVVAAVVMTAAMTPVVIGAKKINAEERECTAKGGVHVRTYDGLTCIKAQTIK